MCPGPTRLACIDPLRDVCGRPCHQAVRNPPRAGKLAFGYQPVDCGARQSRHLNDCRKTQERLRVHRMSSATKRDWCGEATLSCSSEATAGRTRCRSVGMCACMGSTFPLRAIAFADLYERARRRAVRLPRLSRPLRLKFHTTFETTRSEWEFMVRIPARGASPSVRTVMTSNARRAWSMCHGRAGTQLSSPHHGRSMPGR
jgi:hypothetical protein